MEKHMEEVGVKTEDGNILIFQINHGDDSVIVVSPDQVDTLVSWLQEAKAEMESKRRDSPLLPPSKRPH